MCVNIQSYEMLYLYNDNVIFYQAKSFIIYMSEQPTEILILKIEFLSESQLLHCVTPNSNTNQLG